MTTFESDAALTSATRREHEHLLALGNPVHPTTISFTSDSGATDNNELERIVFSHAVAMLVSRLRRSRALAEPRAPGAELDRKPAPDALRLLELARPMLGRIQSDDVRTRALPILDRLVKELGRFDLSNLPPIHAADGDDGAYLLEWTIGQRRIGLSVEPRAEDSGWYFVSLDRDDLGSASGTMSELDLPMLLRRLIRR